MISGVQKAKFDLFLDKKYLTLDKKIKIVILISIFIVPLLLFYFLSFKPQDEKIASLKQQGKTIEEELKKIRNVVKDLPKFKKEFEDIQKEFEAMSVLLPKTQEIPNLLRSISDLGKNNGLDFLRFVPGSEVQKDFYAEIPVDISIVGPYHNLGSFLDKVSKLDRIVTVNNINVDKSAKEDTEVLLSSTCRLLTYRFTNVKPTPPKDGKTK